MSSSEELESWIPNFCSLYGRDYLVEVAAEFIEDDFNLVGLSSMVPYYKEALDHILDFEPDAPTPVERIPLIQHSAELLYGLIHQRYILTKQGLHLMFQKFQKSGFGVCPRYYCNGMSLLPVGQYDLPGKETVRLYCPNCFDLYLPSSSRYLNIDGAFFGTTFPGMFIKMFIDSEDQLSVHNTVLEQYELKIFGFKVHKTSSFGSRMKWLRSTPRTPAEVKEFDKCEYQMPDEQLSDDEDEDEDLEADSDVLM